LEIALAFLFWETVEGVSFEWIFMVVEFAVEGDKFGYFGGVFIEGLSELASI
jgi:hypothetical protein